LRAALTTLRAIRRRRVPEQLARRGRELQTGLNQAARECGAPVHCDGVDYHPQLSFRVPDSQFQAGLATLYIQEMARRGCHGYPAFYLNAAQGRNEVDETLSAARETFALLAEAAEHGSVEPWLECETRSDPFRRLVR
jgi:glutamate-1-semialdehyde 2,1-aminomutase